MLFGFAAVLLAERDLAQSTPAIWQRRGRAFALVAVIASMLMPAGTQGADAETVDLRPPVRAGQIRNVRVQVDVEGKLKLNPDGKEVKHLPLKVQAEMDYVERVLAQGRDWTEVRLARSYGKAAAKIRLRESELVNEIRPARRTIVVDSDGKRSLQFSPLGPLTREELELIETPASGLAPESILPGKLLKLGAKWSLADSTAARLLGLEAVSQNEVECTLDSVKDKVALVVLAGKVSGAIGGVSSDIELKGKLNFDLGKRAVTWLTLAFTENRAIGHAQPGFEVLTTVKLVSAPTQSAAELTDKALAGLKLKAEPSQTLIEMTSDAAGFELVHDRRWQVMVEQANLSVMRLVDQGDLIAQCNISRLPQLPKGEQLTLEGFQDEVKRTLGKSFGTLVEASEEANDAGIRVLRVVVSGTAGELPIQWMYFHLSDDLGHRAAIVFTIESSLLERFAQVDRELIGGFHFSADKQPTLAPPAREAAKIDESGPVLR